MSKVRAASSAAAAAASASVFFTRYRCMAAPPVIRIAARAETATTASAMRMIFFLFRRFFRSACRSLLRRSLSLRWASVSVPAEAFLEEEPVVPVLLTALPDLFPVVLPAFCFCAEEEPDRFLPELPVVFRIG